MLNDLYSPSLALLTDLYQLTMGFGYWRSGIHRRRSTFHLFYRSEPFDGGYAIAAGLGPALEWLEKFQVTQDDVDYLATLNGNDGQSLFSEDFLTAIHGMRLSIDVDAMPEGTVVRAHQPLLRVTGPLWECQWIETALLNIVNFQTLIATKAARVCDAAQGESVLEFGLRRAQGIDGGLSASRAAYIGGCTATSNVLAGRIFGIPARGTHAHSWVMSFDSEIEAFDAYADAMPNNCIFLVDTYDTLEGVQRAIEVGHRLRQRGYQMVGVRLDSGDLAQLSIDARQMLDDAGFHDSAIVASNDLDEYSIADLKRCGATIAIWGVGTNLVTAKDQPALGGVYKLGAIMDDSGQWQPRIKLSELPIKTSTPGIQQVRRYFRDGLITGDMIFSELIGPPRSGEAVAFDGARIDMGDIENCDHADLLEPMMREGSLVGELPSLSQIREHATRQRALLPANSRRLETPESWATGIEERLAIQKRELVEAANRHHNAPNDCS